MNPGGDLTTASDAPAVVPVPTRSPMAFAGGNRRHRVHRDSDLALRLWRGHGNCCGLSRVGFLTPARRPGGNDPRLAVAILAGAIPIASLRDIGATVVVTSGALIAIFIWGMTKIAKPVSATPWRDPLPR